MTSGFTEDRRARIVPGTTLQTRRLYRSQVLRLPSMAVALALALTSGCGGDDSDVGTTVEEPKADAGPDADASSEKASVVSDARSEGDTSLPPFDAREGSVSVDTGSETSRVDAAEAGSDAEGGARLDARDEADVARTDAASTDATAERSDAAGASDAADASVDAPSTGDGPSDATAPDGDASFADNALVSDAGEAGDALLEAQPDGAGEAGDASTLVLEPMTWIIEPAPVCPATSAEADCSDLSGINGTFTVSASGACPTPSVASLWFPGGDLRTEFTYSIFAITSETDAHDIPSDSVAVEITGGAANRWWAHSGSVRVSARDGGGPAITFVGLDGVEESDPTSHATLDGYLVCP